jgi:hypothetical protein
VFAQDGFIMHCKIVICTLSFSNNVKKKVMPVEESGKGRGVEGVSAQLEEIFSKSMDKSSSST